MNSKTATKAARSQEESQMKPDSAGSATQGPTQLQAKRTHVQMRKTDSNEEEEKKVPQAGRPVKYKGEYAKQSPGSSLTRQRRKLGNNSVASPLRSGSGQSLIGHEGGDDDDDEESSYSYGADDASSTSLDDISSRSRSRSSGSGDDSGSSPSHSVQRQRKKSTLRVVNADRSSNGLQNSFPDDESPDNTSSHFIVSPMPWLQPNHPLWDSFFDSLARLQADGRRKRTAIAGQRFIKGKNALFCGQCWLFCGRAGKNMHTSHGTHSAAIVSLKHPIFTQRKSFFVHAMHKGFASPIDLGLSVHSAPPTTPPPSNPLPQPDLLSSSFYFKFPRCLRQDMFTQVLALLTSFQLTTPFLVKRPYQQLMPENDPSQRTTEVHLALDLACESPQALGTSRVLK